MMSRFLRASIFFVSALPTLIYTCPYCAGQNGENYIQAIIVPIAGLLIAPFMLFGVVGCFVYIHKDK